MKLVAWLLSLVLGALMPWARVVVKADRRSDDAGIYTALCAWLYQQPQTMRCIEVR